MKAAAKAAATAGEMAGALGAGALGAGAALSVGGGLSPAAASTSAALSEAAASADLSVTPRLGASPFSTTSLSHDSPAGSSGGVLAAAVSPAVSSAGGLPDEARLLRPRRRIPSTNCAASPPGAKHATLSCAALLDPFISAGSAGKGGSAPSLAGSESLGSGMIAQVWSSSGWCCCFGSVMAGGSDSDTSTGSVASGILAANCCFAAACAAARAAVAAARFACFSLTASHRSAHDEPIAGAFGFSSLSVSAGASSAALRLSGVIADATDTPTWRFTFVVFLFPSFLWFVWRLPPASLFRDVRHPLRATQAVTPVWSACLVSVRECEHQSPVESRPRDTPVRARVLVL